MFNKHLDSHWYTNTHTFWMENWFVQRLQWIWLFSGCCFCELHMKASFCCNTMPGLLLFMLLLLLLLLLGRLSAVVDFPSSSITSLSSSSSKSEPFWNWFEPVWNWFEPVWNWFIPEWNWFEPVEDPFEADEDGRRKLGPGESLPWKQKKNCICWWATLKWSFYVSFCPLSAVRRPRSAVRPSVRP